MNLDTIGQRCNSEPEPELGLGIVLRVEPYRIWVDFPAVGEQRLYARDTTVIRRVRFAEGETISNREGKQLTIVSIEEADGLITYHGNDSCIREDEISNVEAVSAPQDRLMKAQVDLSELFDLRYKTLQARAHYRSNKHRGLLGGRVSLIPHQFYILNEVCNRLQPRILLADEMGLGKTIEACLILQRLLTTGRVSRVLILVPDALVNQWFVELLRKFNLWFSILDEARCRELEKQDIDGNPYLDESWVIGSIDHLAGSEVRTGQAIAAGWDLVIIDEAHHLEWTPQEASAEYLLAEGLSKATQGLLLLTATPTQLGEEGHFARLRLLDPARYSDFETFQGQSRDYRKVAAIASNLIEKRKLTAAARKQLMSLANRGSETLAEGIAAVDTQQPGAVEHLLETLIDTFGPGRVIYRNTREVIKGFPKRVYEPIPLGDGSDTTLINRVRKELEADASGNEDELRYSFAKDPRLLWVVDFLKKDPQRKVLLICKSQRKAVALKAALDETGIRFGAFHEGLTLIQRDRNAAWFAEPDGAQLLVCSEIGSEGRNFQFAHHLVLFDLPLNPGVLEQRIGRLDRIGQTETIHIHVPLPVGSCMEVKADWYHRGLNAFEAPIRGSEAYRQEFGERALNLALAYRPDGKKNNRASLETLIAETQSFREKLNLSLSEGRDRLLELHSFHADKAALIINEIRASEKDETLRTLLLDLLENHGVKITELEGGQVQLEPEHTYEDALPSLPQQGLLASFRRDDAVTREDITFLSQDHPLYRDAIDLLINSPKGSTAFATLISTEVNLALECVFVAEIIAEPKWHTDQYLAPVPIRVVVDVRGKNRSEDLDFEKIHSELKDGNIHRFLEQPLFNLDLLKTLIAGAQRIATRRLERLTTEANTRATEQLGYECKRLLDFQTRFGHDGTRELDLAKTRLEKTTDAIQSAHLRLDSLRILMTGPEAALAKVR